MNSQQTSALSGASANSGEGLASFGARYQAFLNQQPQKIQQKASALGGLALLVRGLVNLAIFLVLFLAILMLFGFGLSRFSSRSNDAQDKVSVTGKQTGTSVAETPTSPSKRE